MLLIDNFADCAVLTGDLDKVATAIVGDRQHIVGHPMDVGTLLIGRLRAPPGSIVTCTTGYKPLANQCKNCVAAAISYASGAYNCPTK